MKPTKVSRLDFLQALESVECGLSPKEALEQSSCYVFKAGRVMAFNGEVLCRCPSGLPEDFEGAVQNRLLEVVRRIPDDEVTISTSDAELEIAGRRDKSYVNLQHEVMLPVESVEKPIKGKWSPVAQEFSEGLKVVTESCGRDEHSFKESCVHFTPGFIEACDNWTFARFKVDTGLKERTLVRVGPSKAIASRGPTEQQATERWMHYRNGSGVYVSAQRDDDEYYNLDKMTKLRGKPTALPKGLVQATERMEVFSKENSDESIVHVQIGKGRMTITAEGVSGRATHTTKVKYVGKPLDFHMGPQTLAKMVDRFTEVQLNESEFKGSQRATLIVQAGRLFFLAMTKNEEQLQAQALEKEKSDED